MWSDREDDWVLVGLRLFECGKLALEQGRGHEMTVACREPARNDVPFTFEIDESNIAPLADENVAIGPFERRAGDDTVITGASRRIDPGRDAMQPWPAVLVRERLPTVHLFDVRGRMEPVAVLVNPMHAMRQHRGNRALAGA